jgi:hypothetical protein
MSDQIRELDDASDLILSGLVRAARHDQLAVEVVIVGLLPLALSRCGRASERVDELIGELAIVVAEAARDGLPPSGRRIANVLLDRAWGRVRRPARRVHEIVSTDAVELGWRLIDRDPDPADLAVNRVVLEELRQSLGAHRSSHRATIRAWNVAVSLADAEVKSTSDRCRLKYARQVLRRSLDAHLFA